MRTRLLTKQAWDSLALLGNTLMCRVISIINEGYGVPYCLLHRAFAPYPCVGYVSTAQMLNNELLQHTPLKIISIASPRIEDCADSGYPP